MIKQRFQKNVLLVAMSVALLNISANATNVEFDDSILKSLGFDNVDLSSFEGSGSGQYVGEYIVDVRLNSNPILSDHTISFYLDGYGESQVCFTPEFAGDISLKETYIKELQGRSEFSDGQQQCLDVLSLSQVAAANFDSTNGILNLSIPQAYLRDVDDYWIPPEKRDYGISGVVLDYSLIWAHDRSKQPISGRRDSNTSLRSYGTVGANIGRFRFRADYQYNSDALDKKFDWSQIYAFTDIGAWNAKLYAGEIVSQSNVFETTRIKGLSLYSDENMMPLHLQGYAPQITGMASTNAIVTISQYGNVMRSVQVPAGPFVISDLPSYMTGTVNVTVEEASGEIQSYQVDISQVPFLTRKGTLRYSLNVGKIDPFSPVDRVDTSLISGDLSYGVTSNISLYGGIQHTTNSEYKAYNIGLGFNLQQFGALSFDMTHAESDIGGVASKRSGQSYRFNYAKRFSSTTTVNIAGYRFSSKGYTGLNNYIDMKQMGGDSGVAFEKNRFSLSVSQYFTDLGVSLTGTISKGTYWTGTGMSNYNISLSKFIRKEGLFRNSSVNLSFSQNRSPGYKSNQRVALYVTIPLGQENSRIQYAGTYNSLTRSIDHEAKYYAEGFGGDYSVGTGISHRRDLSGSIDYSLSATYDARTGYGNFNASADYDEYRQSVRASFDGSLTMTQHGLATHPRNYGSSPRLILDAGASGVPMSSTESKSNVFGLIGVPNVSSYDYATYMVDNDRLPDNVEIPIGVIDVATSDGAIVFRSLGGVSGEKAISTITLADGTYPPFGAVVYRENGEDREIAIVADQGLTYLTGLNKNDKFVVKWNSVHSCELQIKSLSPDELQNLTCY